MRLQWGLFTRRGRLGRGNLIRSTVYDFDMSLADAIDIALHYGSIYQPVLLPRQHKGEGPPKKTKRPEPPAKKLARVQRLCRALGFAVPTRLPSPEARP